MNNHSNEKKLLLASNGLDDYTTHWWDQFIRKGMERHELPIITWEQTKQHLRARFVPRHYKRSLFEKLTGLRQGMRSMDEYHKEMETTMIHADVRENEEQTMARFLASMNHAIKRIVNHYPYNDMIELLHQAREAERQVIEDTRFAARSRSLASPGHPYNNS